jgi:hypothetical protein
MKYKYSFLVLFMFFFQVSCGGVEKPKVYDKINGISLSLSRHPLKQKNVIPLQVVNTNFVSLIPFGFINDLSSPQIRYNTDRQWFGETTQGIKQYVEVLKSKQIEILIKPQLWIRGGIFTGTIEMTTEEDWLTLEVSYENYLLEYARIAEEVNAKIFCIGTELEKFVMNRPDYWQSLIANIKKVYSGKLTYAANWDEFKRVPFWSDLDFIGIDAYFPLSNLDSPSIEELKQGWIPHKQEIDRMQSEYQKPILFTEFGYRSLNFAAKKPWYSNKIAGEINLLNQSNALQVIFDEFWKEEWFAGGFLWKWFIDDENSGGENNNRFTIQNKPAEEIVKLNYAQYK